MRITTNNADLVVLSDCQAGLLFWAFFLTGTACILVGGHDAFADLANLFAPAWAEDNDWNVWNPYED